jgi:hypothetical protein
MQGACSLSADVAVAVAAVVAKQQLMHQHDAL